MIDFHLSKLRSYSFELLDVDTLENGHYANFIQIILLCVHFVRLQTILSILWWYKNWFNLCIFAGCLYTPNQNSYYTKCGILFYCAGLNGR